MFQIPNQLICNQLNTYLMRTYDVLSVPGFVLSDANTETRKIRALPSTEAQQTCGVQTSQSSKQTISPEGAKMP